MESKRVLTFSSSDFGLLDGEEPKTFRLNIVDRSPDVDIRALILDLFGVLVIGVSVVLCLRISLLLL